MPPKPCVVPRFLVDYFCCYDLLVKCCSYFLGLRQKSVAVIVRGIKKKKKKEKEKTENEKKGYFARAYGREQHNLAIHVHYRKSLNQHEGKMNST